MGDPGFRQWPVCSPRRYLRFETIRSISSGRSAARRAVFRPPGRVLARKSVFCYRAPDFVNGPFVALDDIFDLAPSDRFLNFLNQESLRVPKKGGPRKKVFGHFLLLDGSIWTETMLYDPEVTLDNFSFPVGGRSAARRAVFRPPGRILALKSVFCYTTPDFVNGPFVAL